jgi:hypothetical protein
MYDVHSNDGSCHQIAFVALNMNAISVTMKLFVDGFLSNEINDQNLVQPWAEYIYLGKRAINKFIDVHCFRVQSLFPAFDIFHEDFHLRNKFMQYRNRIVIYRNRIVIYRNRIVIYRNRIVKMNTPLIFYRRVAKVL